MHTTSRPGSHVCFHHDGDYRGEVIIAVPATAVEVDLKTATVRVDAADLLAFAVAVVRDAHVGALEDADDEEILGLTFHDVAEAAASALSPSSREAAPAASLAELLEVLRDLTVDDAWLECSGVDVEAGDLPLDEALRAWKTAGYPGVAREEE